jgi:hypothetical protein
VVVLVELDVWLPVPEEVDDPVVGLEVAELSCEVELADCSVELVDCAAELVVCEVAEVCALPGPTVVPPLKPFAGITTLAADSESAAYSATELVLKVSNAT